MTEKQLITKILDVGRLPEGLKTSWFKSKNDKAVVQFIQNHYTTYGQVPSVETVKATFPKFSTVSAPEPTEFYVDRLQTELKYAGVIDTLEAAKQTLETLGVEGAKSLPTAMMESLKQLTFEYTQIKALDIKENPEERLEDYSSGKIEYGITSGLLMLDGKTSGWKKGQLIVLTGRPKRGKTWLMVKWAMEAFRAGKRVLFASLEMTREEIRSRFDALYFGISPTAIENKTAVITKPMRDKAISLQKFKGAFTAVDDAYDITTIQTYVQQFEPDVVFIDAVYLMKDGANLKDADWRKMAEVSRNLKAFAKIVRTPVVISSQLNRQGDVAFSDAFRQDADVLMSLKQTEEMRVANQILLTVDDIRNGVPGDIYLHWDIGGADISELTEAQAWDGAAVSDFSFEGEDD